MMVFYGRHITRGVPCLEHIQRAPDPVGQVCYTMNGPSEFLVIGVIKDWDRTDRLSEHALSERVEAQLSLIRCSAN